MGLIEYVESDHAIDRHKERLNDELGLSDQAINMINLDIESCLKDAVENKYDRFLVCSNLWIEEDDFWHISLNTSVVSILGVDSSNPYSFEVVTYLIWDNRDPLENGQLGNNRKVDSFYDRRHKYDWYEVKDGYIDKPVWIKADSEVEKEMKLIAKEWLVKDKDQIEALKSSREHESEHLWLKHGHYLSTDGFNVDEWDSKNEYPPAYSRKVMKIGGFGFLIYEHHEQEDRDPEYKKIKQEARSKRIGSFSRKIVGLVDFQYHSLHSYHEERSEFIDVTDRKTTWKGRNQKAYRKSKSSAPNDIELNNDRIDAEEKFTKTDIFGYNSIGQFFNKLNLFKSKWYYRPHK